MWYQTINLQPFLTLDLALSSDPAGLIELVNTLKLGASHIVQQHTHLALPRHMCGPPYINNDEALTNCQKMKSYQYPRKKATECHDSVCIT